MKKSMDKILYLCIGCFQIHYDNDYSKEDGDIELTEKFKNKYLEMRSKL